MRVRRTISWLSDDPNSSQLFVPDASFPQLFTLSDNRRRLLTKKSHVKMQELVVLSYLRGSQSP